MELLRAGVMLDGTIVGVIVVMPGLPALPAVMFVTLSIEKFVVSG